MMPKLVLDIDSLRALEKILDDYPNNQGHPSGENQMNDLAKKYFPYADEEVAAKQLASLERAKLWMSERGVVAMTPESKFVFDRCSATVLVGERK